MLSNFICPKACDQGNESNLLFYSVNVNFLTNNAMLKPVNINYVVYTATKHKKGRWKLHFHIDTTTVHIYSGRSKTVPYSALIY